MFVDKVEVKVSAGNGGNGVVSFRHEKFVDKGGPDGGDGGDGGDIVLRASRNQDTLAAFRYKKEIKAENGQSGSKSKKHGKSGADLIIDVPVGTIVSSEQGQVVADLTADEQQAIIAAGGKGGFGNAHFASSRRQTPKVAEKGEPGEKLNLTFELKIIADVGLVGLPNAGKSTLLASVSHAHPEIADYPFTTLTPNLGVVDIDNKNSLLMADIPGLIEGASQGKGLGDEFLRHIERTSVLLHMIDAYNEDIAAAYKTIQKELKDYKIDLTKRPQVVALNKAEGLAKTELELKLKQLQKVVPAKTQVFTISAKSKAGVSELLFELNKWVKKNKASQKRSESKNKLPVLTLTSDESWRIEKTGKDFVVTGSKVERFAKRTDFDSPSGVERFRDIMRKMGITKELERKGIEPGQKIIIGKDEIEY